MASWASASSSPASAPSCASSNDRICCPRHSGPVHSWAAERRQAVRNVVKQCIWRDRGQRCVAVLGILSPVVVKFSWGRAGNEGRDVIVSACMLGGVAREIRSVRTRGGGALPRHRRGSMHRRSRTKWAIHIRRRSRRTAFDVRFGDGQRVEPATSPPGRLRGTGGLCHMRSDPRAGRRRRRRGATISDS